VLVTLGITQLDENTIGLVMEYCAGGSLWSQIKDHPPQSKQQVLDMLVSIASGLEHLHSNGIIHRDVAARNVLVSTSSRNLPLCCAMKLILKCSKDHSRRSLETRRLWNEQKTERRRRLENKSNHWTSSEYGARIDSQWNILQKEW
jgi:serine/threonine protein kinase